jgi:hypothetical protein
METAFFAPPPHRTNAETWNIEIAERIRKPPEITSPRRHRRDRGLTPIGFEIAATPPTIKGQRT